MPQTITLTLPDQLYQPFQRIARATQQPIEALTLTALQNSPLPLTGLSVELTH